MMSSGSANLFLDFDGPVCKVFAGLPASDVARQLRDSLRAYTPHGWMLDTTDPHEILRATAALSQEVSDQANRILRDLEIQAVQSASPTPFALDVITDAKASGAQVAVVSNNAQDAVVDYLVRNDISALVDCVSARESADPLLMKPSTYLIDQAVTALQADRERSVLVGDQVSDVLAAHRAGIRAIGYANKPGKLEKLAAADKVVTSMAELLAGGWSRLALPGAG